MSYISKQEAIASAWKHVMTANSWFFIGVALLILLICICMVLPIAYFTSNNLIMIASICILSGLATTSIYMLGMVPRTPVLVTPRNSVSVVQVARQNIRIARDRRRLPRWIRQKNRINHRYEYLASRADHNLEKPQPYQKYGTRFHRIDQRIKNAESLMSYTDPRHVAVTEHGGYHHLPSRPTLRDYTLGYHIAPKKVTP